MSLAYLALRLLTRKKSPRNSRRAPRSNYPLDIPNSRAPRCKCSSAHSRATSEKPKDKGPRASGGAKGEIKNEPPRGSVFFSSLPHACARACVFAGSPHETHACLGLFKLSSRTPPSRRHSSLYIHIHMYIPRRPSEAVAGSEE